MATRPAPAKKTPAKKAAAKTPAAAARKAKTAAPAPKSEAIAAPVVTLKAVFEQLGETQTYRRNRPTPCSRTSWPRSPRI